MINDMQNGQVYRLKDIENTFKRLALNENIDYMTCVTQKDCLFDTVEGRFRPLIDGMVPVRPSTAECQWLKMILKAPECSLFLDQATQQIINHALVSVPDLITEASLEDKNIHYSTDPLDSEIFIQSLQVLMDAIDHHQIISYNYTAQDGQVYNDLSAIPYKIEYSILNAKFRLFMYTLESKKPVKINISQLNAVWINDTAESLSQEAIEEQILSCKAKSPLILEVENTEYILERCFSLFSPYNRETYFDSEKNVFVMKLDYYTLDEAELVKDILSFGSHIIVNEPTHVRDLIITRIRKAIG